VVLAGFTCCYCCFFGWNFGLACCFVVLAGFSYCCCCFVVVVFARNFGFGLVLVVAAVLVRTSVFVGFVVVVVWLEFRYWLVLLVVVDVFFLEFQFWVGFACCC